MIARWPSNSDHIDTVQSRFHGPIPNPSPPPIPFRKAQPRPTNLTTPHRQSLPLIFRNHASLPFFPAPAPPSPFSKSRISVSLTTSPPLFLSFFSTSGVPGGALRPAPAMTPDRLRWSREAAGPGLRPVRRREARLMDSRTRHWRFLARMKSVIDSTMGGLVRGLRRWER